MRGFTDDCDRAADEGKDSALRATVKNYLPAIACALTPIIFYVMIRPYAEIGINDDWAYIKTTQVLAQTGHIVYNGWEAAMLGWQAYFGAWFVKLFGFSFTAVRFSTVIEAMTTAFLLQRIFERAGLNSWNATLATMCFVLSPLYLPLTYTFMSDVPGVLCIVVCLYMCLRAVAAAGERSAMAWVGLAALTNALGGTARQIAWLGVLIMVPSTLWLLRRNRRVLIAGCLFWIAGIGIAVAAMHWFARQQYILPESAIPDRIGQESLLHLMRIGWRSTGQLAFLAIPVLLMFAGSLRSWNRRKVVAVATVLLCFAVPAIVLIVIGDVNPLLAPFVSDYMTASTVERLDAIAAQGLHLPAAWNSLHIFLTGATVLGIVSLAACLFAGKDRRPSLKQTETEGAWRRFCVIAGPFSMAYAALLGLVVLRNDTYNFFGRYLLPLLAILLLVLVRFYQQRVREHLPWLIVLPIAIFGGFAVTATHDTFALYRGYASAIGRMQSSGVLAANIDGPWEFEGWTEIEKTGHVNDSRIRVPQDAYAPHRQIDFSSDCEGNLFLTLAPAIKPVYAITLDPDECRGEAAFPPMEYRTWIAPHANWIYSVRLPPSFAH